MTASAREHLQLPEHQITDRQAIIDRLALRFPELPALAAQTSTGQTSVGQQVVEHHGASHQISGLSSGESLALEMWGDFTRITLTSSGATSGAELMQLAAAQDELQTLRSIAEDSPQLIWKEDGNGTVVWANSAYLDLADRVNGMGPVAAPGWPGRPILGQVQTPPDEGAVSSKRVALDLPGGDRTRWYEVTMIRRGQQGVGFAVEVTAIVAADDTKRNFVQTLTKTFADLRIGLTIFDRHRRMVLFNPAFVDLTGLPIEFLTQRPLVLSVLDLLRDMQMLPEPKNYTSWREQVMALEAAALGSGYCENWVLPGGRTWRVTGRPHPDGALAFLFEDITDEVSLSRHIRMEQETAQAVLDLLPQAVAVFSPARTLVLANHAYDQLWSIAGPVLDTTLGDEIARWRAEMADGPLRDRLVEALESHEQTDGAQIALRMLNGRVLVMKANVLPAGALAIEFHDPAGLGAEREGKADYSLAEPVFRSSQVLPESGMRLTGS